MTTDTARTTGTAVLERATPGVGGRSADEDLRAALEAGDLTVHLQPQTALADGRTVGVEALVRWEHPSRGVLAPRELLPVAERAGLHRPLAESVLDLALASAARWWSGRAPLPVSVNLAAANVVDATLTGTVAATLARHALPPRALTVEVVGDAVTAGGARARAVLHDLRALGVSVSVDDYATGSRLLTAPGWLPVDELKLDPAVVAGVARDPRAAAVVRSTVALAHVLGLRVVAEGVEDAATLRALAAVGCDGAQGFAIAAAMPVDGFVHWLRVRGADRIPRYPAVPRPRDASRPG
jgi:diguanylate cyclase